MRNNFEVPVAPLSSHLGEKPPNRWGWSGVLLGAAVSIAGPAYFGTLFSNVTLSLLIRQGHSMREAYAYLFQFSWSLPVVANLISDICFSFACGWVAACFGGGSPMRQGAMAGLLAVTFPVIMLTSPASGPVPLPFIALTLIVPILGSVAGAYAYSRRSRAREP